MKRRQGFTLVEILIGLVIVAIGLVMAIPNLQRWIYHSNFTGFQRSLFSECQEARTRAIASQYQHGLLINFTAGQVTLQRGNAGTNSATWSDVRSAISIPTGCSLNEVLTTQGGATTITNTGTVRIVFNPAGDTYPLDDARIHIGSTVGDLYTIHIYGWTAKARMENGWT